LTKLATSYGLEESMVSIRKASFMNIPRDEYHMDLVTAKRNDGAHVFFVGDSTGSTEYQKGESLCRGLREVDFLFWNKNFNMIPTDWENVATRYNKYWKDFVVPEEFEKSASEFLRQVKYYSFRPQETFENYSPAILDEEVKSILEGINNERSKKIVDPESAVTMLRAKDKTAGSLTRFVQEYNKYGEKDAEIRDLKTFLLVLEKRVQKL